MFSGRGPPGPPPNGPPGQPPLGPPGGPLGPGMTQGGPGDGTWNPTGAPGQGDGSWQSPGQPLPGLLGALGGGLGGGGLGVGVGMGLGPMIPPVLPPGGPGGAEGGGPPPLAPPVLGPGASPPHGTGSSPHSLTPPGGVDLQLYFFGFVKVRPALRYSREEICSKHIKTGIAQIPLARHPGNAHLRICLTDIYHLVKFLN